MRPKDAPALGPVSVSWGLRFDRDTTGRVLLALDLWHPMGYTVVALDPQGAKELAAALDQRADEAANGQVPPPAPSAALETWTVLHSGGKRCRECVTQSGPCPMPWIFGGFNEPG